MQFASAFFLLEAVGNIDQDQGIIRLVHYST